MPIRDVLQAELTTAMRRHDRAVAAALRNALGALANAEAIEVPDTGSPLPVTSAHVAGTTSGLGAAEAPRRHLTEDQQRGIVTRERDQLLAHVDRLRQQCRPDDADAARRAASALEVALAIRP